MNIIVSFQEQRNTLLEMKLNYLYLILTKIYEQIDHNEEFAIHKTVTRGSFQWENGIKDTKSYIYTK